MARHYSRQKLTIITHASTMMQLAANTGNILHPTATTTMT